VARFYWCKTCETTHERVLHVRNCDPEPWPRGDYPTPAVISDYLPGGVNGLYHHGVAKKIDSKSGFRRATRESGCIEVGNEYAATTRREDKPLGKDVIASGLNEALARHGIVSECDTRKLDYGLGQPGS
jgi:hypothetical protein